MHSTAAVYLVILSFQAAYCDDPNHQMCATSEAGKYGGAMSKPVPRIVGEAINATYAPFQVGLIFVNKTSMEIGGGCGGTIISQRFVLTAGHCLEYTLKQVHVVVVFGSLNWCTVLEAVKLSLKENPKGPWKNAVLAEKLYKHPDYASEKGMKNDIAIIKLSKELDFENGKVLPACLPPRSGGFSIEGKTAMILGWGGTIDKANKTSQGKLPCDLLKANTQVDVGHRCPTASVLDSSTNTQICTHHEDGPPAQACFGDSGGPLIMDEGGYGVVIGVVSYGQMPKCPQSDWKCLADAKCNKDEVDVFTKVEAYLPWIKKTTGQGLTCPSGFRITYGSMSGDGFESNKNKVSDNQGSKEEATGIEGQRSDEGLLECAKECAEHTMRKGWRRSGCCNFEWSHHEMKCKLHHDCITSKPQNKDFFTCRKEGHDCLDGFELHDGNVKGKGIINGMNKVEDQAECWKECFSSSDCCSYEYSPSAKMCNLNRKCEPEDSKVGDFLFCKKLKKP